MVAVLQRPHLTSREETAPVISGSESSSTTWSTVERKYSSGAVTFGRSATSGGQARNIECAARSGVRV